MSTTLILEALENCIRALQSIPTGETDGHQAEIAQAQQALELARDLARQETVEKILGALYLQDYDRDYILYRITIGDFASLLADRLVEKDVAFESLTSDELSNLLDTVSDYLNGEGMPWAHVINIALDDAWPKRLAK